MRVGALVLGIIGGLVALGLSIVGMYGTWFWSSVSGIGIQWSILIIVLSIVAIIGGAIALARTKAAGILMIISSLGIVFISILVFPNDIWFYLFPVILLIIGAILALVVRPKAKVD